MVPFRNRPSREERRNLDQTNDSNNPFERQGERDQYIMTFPIHPLPSMQAPFEESMLDATGETGFVPFQNPNKNLEIRQQLLCKDLDASELEWNFTYSCHWRNNSKGKYHPLLKTITQIAFGVHLLHQHLEKSVADVADILLKHVNELDSFLQRANEDIEASLKDMLFRRKCLKVPMEHVSEFDRLLDDRMYRAQLLDGNVTIERTINRMSGLLNDYFIDMSTFRDANHELDVYLSHIGDAWVDENDDVGRIYSAMCGNTTGWSQFLLSLVAKAEKLGVVLVQVSSYCNEIEKRCGAASRRSMIASRSSSRNSSSRDTSRSFRNFGDNKPLPMVPNERPPFMTSPSGGSDSGTAHEDVHLPRYPDNKTPARTAGNIRVVVDSDSDDSLQQAVDESGQASRPSQSNLQHSDSATSYVSEPGRQPGFYRENSSPANDELNNQDQKDSSSRLNEEESKKREERRRPEPLPHSDSDTSDTIVAKRAVTRGRKGDGSPPLTGKDSAYSSVSGGSFASPTVAQPRSASSQSSHPRAQFGLFPSSTPSTPKHSLTGRHGAMSPAFPSPRLPEQPAYYPVQRSVSALDSHNTSSKRLLKKSSLSSLKRLFTKKKHGSVDTIAE